MNFPHSFEGQNYHIRFKTEIEDQSLPKMYKQELEYFS